MVQGTKVNADELLARIAELEQQNAALKAARIKPIVAKVSDRGAISLYGLQRFPVTLYVNQWERIIEHVPALQAFIIANRDALSVKEA